MIDKNSGPEGRLLEVRNILISQPRPAKENSPYLRLAADYDVKVHFRSFIQVKPLGIAEYKKQKIQIEKYTAVIFTSRMAVDHFFRLQGQARGDIPHDIKYFCVSRQTANYLQKYVAVRRRKLFVGGSSASDLFNTLGNHGDEYFLFPCSKNRQDDIPTFLSKQGFRYSEAFIYHTVSANLSDISLSDYDLIALFSPSGIHSLFENFPDFRQGKLRIAAFGPATSQAVRDSGLLLDIPAPQPDTPSMAAAIEKYVKDANPLQSGPLVHAR